MSTNLPGEFRIGETPDPLNLARLANEFFAAMSSGRAAPMGAEVPAMPINPLPVPAQGVGVAPPAIPALPQPATPPIPATPGAGDASFGFLQDIRPRYAEPDQTEADLDAYLKRPGEPVPAITGPGEPPVPSSAGIDSTPVPAFSFLDEARPLFWNPPDVQSAVSEPGASQESSGDVVAVPTPPMPTMPGGRSKPGW